LRVFFFFFKFLSRADARGALTSETRPVEGTNQGAFSSKVVLF
jgi:hypothetical protein